MPAPEWSARVDAVRDLLTSDGRSLTQGAPAWLWARSPRTVPIPGFPTVAQAEDNAGAREFGPLAAGAMAELEAVLGRDGRPGRELGPDVGPGLSPAR